MDSHATAAISRRTGDHQKSIRMTARLGVGLLTSTNPASANTSRLPTWSSPQVISTLAA